MSFDSVRDQRVAIRLLRNTLRRGRVPHGLLFFGPAGVGKRLAAMEFAKALNCLGGNGQACGACLACRKIDHGNYPDFYQAAPMKKSRNIDVEAIDEIIEMASLRPFEGKWRVFLIHDADRMRAPAQNHLLKTLEEPLGNSVFLLLTEYPQFLLPTIRSRCQRVRFGALAADTVAEIVRSLRDVSEEEARAAALVAQGQVSRALDLVDSEKRSVVLDVAERLQKGEDPLAITEEFCAYLQAQRAQAESTAKSELEGRDRGEMSREDREQAKEEQQAHTDALNRRVILDHLYLLETWYRDALVYGATGDLAKTLNRDRGPLLREAASTGTDEKVRAIEKARLYLERFLPEERVFRDLFFTLAS